MHPSASERQRGSESTARQESASPRSQASQDASYIRPVQLKPSSLDGGYKELVSKETPEIQQLTIFFEQLHKTHTEQTRVSYSKCVL